MSKKKKKRGVRLIQVSFAYKCVVGMVGMLVINMTGRIRRKRNQRGNQVGGYSC